MSEPDFSTYIQTCLVLATGQALAAAPPEEAPALAEIFTECHRRMRALLERDGADAVVEMARAARLRVMEALDVTEPSEILDGFALLLADLGDSAEDRARWNAMVEAGGRLVVRRGAEAN